MPLKTRVGQIFLEHPKDENYASMYEETFSKQGQSVQLFAVMEIAGDSQSNQYRNKNFEYENLTRSIVTVFKKTYVSAPTVDENTFERALAAIDAAIGKAGAKTKINWFGKLNVVLAAFAQDELCVTTTGTALVYLYRNGNLNTLSQDLAEEPKIGKIFSNYATGKLTQGDRVILSTKQLFNYLSIEKIREELKEENLEDLCHEIISALADIKNIGFATFIFETNKQASTAKLSPSSGAPEGKTKPSNKYIPVLLYIWSAVKSIAAILMDLLGTLFDLIVKFFGKKSRASGKSAKMVTGLILALLLISIGFSVWKKFANENLQIENSRLVQVENLVNEAEAAAIYQDDGRVVALLKEAEGLLAEIKNDSSSAKTSSLRERIANLKDKINKETVIQNPTVLTTFPMIPTDVIGSSNGLLAFNRNTSVLAFYDFRSGETKKILENRNTSSLVLGGNAAGVHGYIFFVRGGKFARVDITNDTSLEYQSENPNLAEPEKANIQDLSVLGEGSSARIYLLDLSQNQIWRFRITDDQTIGSAEGWLKDAAALSEAKDMAVDNNIYVLFSDRVEKYFNGSPQNFTLSAVSPAIQNAVRIFSVSDQQMLYLLEPSAERILIYDKNGRLQMQLKSPKFRDASDLSVDEKNKIIYLIAGSELLQVNF